MVLIKWLETPASPANLSTAGGGEADILSAE